MDVEKEVLSKESTPFSIPVIIRKEGNEDRYNKLLKENELLFTLDVIMLICSNLLKII